MINKKPASLQPSIVLQLHDCKTSPALQHMNTLQSPPCQQITRTQAELCCFTLTGLDICIEEHQAVILKTVNKHSPNFVTVEVLICLCAFGARHL